MKPGYRFYRVCYRLVSALSFVFCRLRVIGKDNIPDGAAMVCANHSSIIDPFLIALAFGIEHQMHIIAKIELFRIPVVSQILNKLGMISVDRGVLDAASVKTTLSYLKNGEKVVIFPEGTRTSEDDAISAKAGAVKTVERTGVPLVPLFIPRKKALFGGISVVIGMPYYIEKQTQKRTLDEYTRLSETLMEKIKSLNPLLPVQPIQNSEFGIRN